MLQEGFSEQHKSTVQKLVRSIIFGTHLFMYRTVYSSNTLSHPLGFQPNWWPDPMTSPLTALSTGPNQDQADAGSPRRESGAVHRNDVPEH